MILGLLGEALFDLTFALTSQPIAYWREGSLLKENVPAKLGHPTVKTEDTRTMVVQEHQVDFLCRVSDLPSPGFRPEVGDVIVCDGGRYQVSRPAKIPFSGMPANAPCWAWHTRQSRSQMRIHAKYIGEVGGKDEPGG